jgi:phage terminase small subunit
MPVKKGTKYLKTTKLTPAQKKFAKEYAKTDNGRKAIERAFPENKNSSDNYKRLKAHRLITNDNIQREIEYQKNAIAMLASRAVNRVGTLIDSEKEDIALRSSTWVYEQVHGKAMQKSTSVNINFTQEVEADGFNI